MASGSPRGGGEARSTIERFARYDHAVSLAWRHFRIAGWRGVAGVIGEDAVPGISPRRQGLGIPVSFRGDWRRGRRDGGSVREGSGSREDRGGRNDRERGGVRASAGENGGHSILAMGRADTGNL